MREFVLYSHYIRAKENAVAKIIRDINKHVDAVHKINLHHSYFLYIPLVVASNYRYMRKR